MPFDQGYYQRFYLNSRTAVTTAAEMGRRAALIAAGANYLELPVRKILDAGCGLGLLRAPLRKLLPRARYVGMEVSDYLCERYGWEHGTIEDWKGREHFDLVICYDVLQYLDAQAARRAIANLARICRGMLYFGALTRADWELHCDQSRTDRIAGLRSGAWYRRELDGYFASFGCGMWLRRDAPVVAWDLDRAK